MTAATRLALALTLTLIGCGEADPAPSPPPPPSGTPALRALPPGVATADCLASVVAGGEPPRALSATGCVRSVEPLVLADELVPYAVASPLFSDYAAKERWIALPPGAVATFGAEDFLEVPVGTRFAKLFARPTEADPVNLELRFSVQLADGVRFFSYRFADGDAVLMTESATEVFAVPGDLEAAYLYPGPESCPRCHSRAAPLLGLSAPQLALPVQHGAEPARPQLEVWRDRGLVEAVPDVPAMPRPSDPSAPLEARARAYLHANCGGCHRPGGYAPPELTMDLRWSTPTEDTRTRCEYTQYPGTASDGLRLSPHDPWGSILVRRMRAAEGDFPSPMPPIGRSLPDEFGAALVAEWAATLPPCEW